jgi:serine/threonine protein kinase
MSIPHPRPQSSDSWDAVSLTPPGDVSRIALVLDEYVQLRGIGQEPKRDEFLARHAAIADELLDYLDGLDLVLSAQDDDLLATDDMENSPSEDLTPSMRLGEYRIIREIGRGGMGVVYEAEQLALGRRVALKVLPSAVSMDSRQRQRFQLEAQAVALLQHEHIVPIYGVGYDQGVHYYAMQFIDGRSLTEIMRERRATGPAERSSLPDGKRSGSPSSASPTAYCRAAARYGFEAAAALQHAHDAGVIHRDIKPSNLMVDTRSHLWVTDFGLAHLPHDDPSLTRTGDLVGTLRYMSPERVRGDQYVVDARTDIYALGLTLYELLTLRPAFVATDRQELLRRILQDEPVAPRRINPSISRDLETIILKATAKEAEARYATARELADDLGRFLNDQPIRARRPNLLERTSRWSRRHRSVVLTAVTVLLVTLSVSTVLLWRAKQRTDAALDTHRLALVRMRIASEHSIANIDQITEILTNPIDGSGPRRGPEADRIFRSAIQYYNKLVAMPLDDQLVSELGAKVLRRRGYLRLVLGQATGKTDYEQAIQIYETLIQQHADWIWLRTGLIETLREYSRSLSTSGDAAAAESRFRHALRLAADLVGNPDTASPCYHKALIEPFNGLASDLLARRSASPSDVARAIRLARQAIEWESTEYPSWPCVPRAHRILAVAHVLAGDWAAASSVLEKATASNGAGDLRDRLFLAILRRRSGDVAQPEKDPG